MGTSHYVGIEGVFFEGLMKGALEAGIASHAENQTRGGGGRTTMVHEMEN